MMEWLIVTMLILIGIVLVILEFLVFPGVNVAGIIGFVCIIAGIYFGYEFYGAPTGHLILLGTAVFAGAVTWYALRSDTWKGLSLHAEVGDSVEGVDETAVHPGDTGIAVGRLAPMGNVRVGSALREAESLSGYIDAGSEVEVLKVLKNKIIVQLKTQ